MRAVAGFCVVASPKKSVHFQPVQPCGRLNTSLPQHMLWQRSAAARRARRNVNAAVASQHTSSVDQIYELCRDLAPGEMLNDDEKERLDALIEDVEESKPPGSQRPLDNPQIFGNWQVAYTSTRKAPRQEGQPAGGRFRGRLGRQLFRTTQLCQSTIQPNIVTNKVGFRLLGLLAGYVGLRGSFEIVGDAADTVKVSFQRPVMCLGDNISLHIGPDSSVQLTTTYLDERMRLGRGSRGSRFVFVRGGYADEAGMDQVGLRATTPAGWAMLALALAGLVAGTVQLAQGSSVVSKGVAGLMGLLAAAIVAVSWRGGQQ